MELFEDEVISPVGTLSYTHVKLKDGVMIVPVKVENQKLTFYMVEEYRYPAGSKMFEFPGGAIDPQETPEQAAHRELKEETGCTANMKLVHVIRPIPGESSARTFVYLANVQKEGEPKIEETERAQGLKLVKFTDDEVLELIRGNEIFDARSLASLMVCLFQNKNAIDIIRKELG